MGLALIIVLSIVYFITLGAARTNGENPVYYILIALFLAIGPFATVYNTEDPSISGLFITGIISCTVVLMQYFLLRRKDGLKK